MEEKHINKKITFSIVAVLLIVLVTIGATYAYFSAQAQTDIQTVTTGTLTMGFTNGDIVNATGITPIADSEIETKATALPFSITNTGNQHMNITIKLTDITIDDALKDIDFRWGLYNSDKQDAAGTEMGIAFGIFKYSENSKEEIIYRDSIIDAGAPAKNYVLRIWIHDDGALQNEMQGKTFSAKVTVTGEAIEYTPESCFTFDSSTGTITAYDETTCGTDVVIPKTLGGVTVKNIGGFAFQYDEDLNNQIRLSSVIIPDSVVSIGDSAFNDNELKYLTIPESVTYIDYFAFGWNMLESILFPESIVETGTELFVYNDLKTLILPGISKISQWFTEGYEGPISDIVLMEGITTIDGVAFESGAGEESLLTSVEIPSSVTTIGSGAFAGHENLKEIIVRGKTEAPSTFENGWNCVRFFSDDTCDQVSVVFRP